MKKLNKKGFTLIEMLVVIAIIAVLVAIIIPTISSATTKAAAAANAANLRAYKAELTTGYLSGDITVSGKNFSKAAGAAHDLPTAPNSKKCLDIDADVPAAAEWDGTEFKVTFSSKNISFFAAVAETGKAPAPVSNGNSGNQDTKGHSIIGVDPDGNPMLG